MTIEYAGMSFVIAIALMITALIIVIIWQGSKIAQTKMKVAAEIYKEEAYRQLAEDVFSSIVTLSLRACPPAYLQVCHLSL